MDLLTGEIESLAVKTWFWKLVSKNHKDDWASWKFDDEVLGLAILTSSKTSKCGNLIIAEECKMDDVTHKMVYRLQVVLTYAGQEKALSIETEFRWINGEKFYIYYLEGINTRDLLKITCTFLETKTCSETAGDTGNILYCPSNDILLFLFTH